MWGCLAQSSLPEVPHVQSEEYQILLWVLATIAAMISAAFGVYLKLILMPESAARQEEEKRRTGNEQSHYAKIETLTQASIDELVKRGGRDEQMRQILENNTATQKSVQVSLEKLCDRIDAGLCGYVREKGGE